MNENITKTENNTGDKTMLKSNLENEITKRKYYDFLKESQGYSDGSISAVKKSIYRYEEFTDFEDFSKFTKKKAVDYKKWLEEKKDPRSKKQISITTCYHYLRLLKDFFKWLSYQPSYKSKINPMEVEFLKLPKEKVRIANSHKREHYPSLGQVKEVVSTIQIRNELDMRDRALISFTLLSGMRNSAICSLPLGCFDVNTLQVCQDPKRGVKTKFSKTINSLLFKFDDDMLNYILEWVRYLKEVKHFNDTDPMFPKNKVENAQGANTFFSDSVEPAFWQSVTSLREVFKQRFKNAGLEYFPPHCFRHLAVNIAVAKCRNGHEIKAVSQNFGHEDVGTTMTTYGKISNTQVSSLISGMDFSNSNDNDSELILKFQEFLKQQSGGKF